MEEIVRALRKFRDDRNWSQFHTPKDLAISVSIEAGELLEIFQWQHDGHDLSGLDLSRVASEAADVLIYTLMLFDRLGLDSSVETMKKILENAERYPVHKTLDRPAALLKERK
jgi:dCTP diphosphatase